MCVCVCVCVCLCLYIYIYIYIYIYTHIYMYICIYMCVYISSINDKTRRNNILYCFISFFVLIVCFQNGIGTNAQFGQCEGVVMDSSGNLFVSDRENNLVRRIAPSGLVSTFAGSGTGGFADGVGYACLSLTLNQSLSLCVSECACQGENE
jgi:hypothetical protein